MSARIQEQVIALAAVFQAASLVDQLARTGDIPEESTTPLLDSLFQQNPRQFSDIYGDAGHRLNAGLKQLKTVIEQQSCGINHEVTRYSMSLLHLERKLSKSADMLTMIGKGIQQASRQAEHFSVTHENTVAAVADLYKKTLSKLSFRIRVTGNPDYLQNPQTANKVRALLLTGVRAAMLWRQVGGKRWRFLLQRKAYIRACDELLDK